ncbi:MAG: polyphosphate kinase 1, partial [Oligoflexus sp.]
SERKESESPAIAFVEVPSILPRLITVPQNSSGHRYVLLEDLITANLDSLFFGMPMKAAFPIRITRNLDYTLLESEVTDLMSSIQTEVKAREQAEVVRLELTQGLPHELRVFLQRRFSLEPSDIYEVPGPLALNDLNQLYELDGEGWHYEPFNPRLPARMQGSRPIFSLIREADLMLHHPFESFYAVIELLHAAAWDPDVLAIKQTLYRTSGDSPIIDALIQAAEQGKQVTAVVELKARFDEHNNIVWARRMERAGVHVVYGFIGLKTHCKMTLIVRREDKRLQRYVHLSTGNYNSSTARHYVDIGYITTRPDIADDASLLFNLLTGFNMLSHTDAQLAPLPAPMRKLILAPLYLREALCQMIDREIAAHEATGQGLIIAKMNALVDPLLIDKLYQASQVGVEIRLIVRGICCLRPQVPGLSETIEVRSIVGRFLEHSRIFYFHNQGQKDIYLGSADWMQRNMDRRIEIVFPVEDATARDRLLYEILEG